MLGRIILIFSLIVLSACAEPKYIRETAPSNPESSQQSADCQLRFSASGLCLSWKWEQIPKSNTKGVLLFKIYRANAVDGSIVMVDPEYDPKVVLWMPSMGHGSTPTVVTREDVGTYRAREVFFVMPGEWEIKFQEKVEDKIRDEAVVRIHI